MMHEEILVANLVEDTGLMVRRTPQRARHERRILELGQRQTLQRAPVGEVEAVRRPHHDVVGDLEVVVRMFGTRRGIDASTCSNDGIP